MDFEKSIRGNKARENFNSGYNCSQSVLLAYEDYLQEKGLDPKTVLRMASPMGGGISRLREICGAVSSLCQNEQKSIMLNAPAPISVQRQQLFLRNIIYKNCLNNQHTTAVIY